MQMERRLVYAGPKRVDFEQYAEPDLGPREVRVRTLCSGISHGTEMRMFRGEAPVLKKEWDPGRRLFVDRTDSNGPVYPTRPLAGYASVGRVVEIGREVSLVNLGDLVFAGAGHETSSTVSEESLVKLPEGLSPALGVFCANLNTTLNGILDAGINLGEVVAVFGQGTLGQLLSQMAKLSGAGCVIAVDAVQRRLDLSRELGADETIDVSACEDVAATIKELTENRGADVAIEVSGSDRALNDAIRCVAFQSTVVAMSWYPEVCRHLRLAEEFHFNRVRIKVSQTGAVSPELSVRWDQKRRLAMVSRLLQTLRLKELITHTYDFMDAQVAYETIDANPEDMLQVVLRYGVDNSGIEAG